MQYSGPQYEASTRTHRGRGVHYMPEAEQQRHAHVPLMSRLLMMMMMMMSLEINDQRSVKAQVFTLLLFHLQAILTSGRDFWPEQAEPDLKRLKLIYFKCL